MLSVVFGRVNDIHIYFFFILALWSVSGLGYLFVQQILNYCYNSPPREQFSIGFQIRIISKPTNIYGENGEQNVRCNLE